MHPFAQVRIAEAQIAVVCLALLFGGCRPLDGHLCAPCSLDVCGDELRCLEGVCVPPDLPEVCANYIPPPACGDGSPCAQGLECFEGACRAPLEVEAGWGHVCALWRSGRVACWGGVESATGRRQRPDTRRATQLPDIDDAVDLSAGIGFSCALRETGDVYCWGENGRSELGNFDAIGPAETRAGPAPQRVTLSGPATRIFSAEHRSCALLADGTLACWGAGGRGCLFATEAAHDTLLPIEVATGVQTEEVGIGDQHTAWLQDGRVYGFGVDDDGQLGGVGRSCKPIDLGFDNVTHLAVGALHTCVVQHDTRVECRGRTAGLQSHVHPRPIAKIFAKRWHSCLVDVAGEVWCWGRDRGGVLGSFEFFETPDGPETPVRLPAATGASHLTMGSEGACLVRDEDGVSCWGLLSKLADGRRWVQPADEMARGDFTDVQAGAIHACALTRAGSVVCWGRNVEGQLGRGRRTFGETSAPVPGVRAEAISVGGHHACALSDDGAVSCWGQLYVAFSLFDSASPVRLEGLPPVRAVSSGWNHLCVLTVDDEVLCAGGNFTGQVDRNLGNPVRSFRRIAGADGAVQVVAGSGSTCVRFSDDRVACWGNVNSTTIPEAFAFPGETVPGVLDVSLGNGNVFMHLRDGRVLAAGLNGGRLGDGRAARPSATVEVFAMTDVLQAVGYSYHSCALRAGGDVWCWGHIPGEVLTSRPVQRPDLRGAARLAVGDWGRCIIRADNRVICEGANLGFVPPQTEFSVEPRRVVGLVGRGPVD